jgi:hypothetical protein
MKRFNLIAAALVMLYAGMAHAQWYQVEIIVFETVNPLTDGEVWNEVAGLPPLTFAVPLVIPEQAAAAAPATTAVPAVPGVTPAAAPLVPYSILPESRHRLQNVYRLLRQSRDYRPVYHVSWLQPGQDGPRSRAVQLQTESVDSLFELTMPPLLVTDPLPVEFYEPIQLLIDGTVRIRSSSFLYADLDLVLFKPPPAAFAAALPAPGETGAVIAAAPQPDPPEYVRLRESRRIRLNDLQYFDHPLFGAIMQVSRYETEPAN